MNKIVKFLLLFIFFNIFCSLSGFLFPQIPMRKVLPIQIWIDVLLIFYILLPEKTATFLKNI